MKKEYREILKRLRDECKGRGCEGCRYKRSAVCYPTSPIPEKFIFASDKKEKRKKTVTYVKPFSKILAHATENGATLDQINRIDFKLVYPDDGIEFCSFMIKYCCQPKPSAYFWRDEWLEEREV